MVLSPAVAATSGFGSGKNRTEVAMNTLSSGASLRARLRIPLLVGGGNEGVRVLVKGADAECVVHDMLHPASLGARVGQ